MSGEKSNKLQGMDTQILVDALAVIMGHEEKELCKPGSLALMFMVDTASTILGSKDRVSMLVGVGWVGGWKEGWQAGFVGCHHGA